MSHIMEMPAFTVKKGVSEADFLRAHEKFNREFVSQQYGYVFHRLIRDGDQWFDLIVWDSVESKEKAFEDIYAWEGLDAYMSCIDQVGTDDDIPLYTVVKTY